MWPVNARPLQMITPPLMGKAGVTARDLWTAWTSGSAELLSSYTTASLFPGGRFARSVAQTIENPAWASSYILGLPITNFKKDLMKPR